MTEGTIREMTMGELSSYLAIAGLAHRQAAELKQAVADGAQHFPNGEQTFLASEIACCEAVIASVRAVFAQHFRVLEFSADGKAAARIPPALRDLMSEEEPTIVET
ncbi:hypothetical protein BRADO6376 [Bradyrhizobium sp. ORS 278]|nr:hypothetical protein BRADO6376 [Bradyrhizobium sp. ORS 278]